MTLQKPTEILFEKDKKKLASQPLSSSLTKEIEIYQPKYTSSIIKNTLSEALKTERAESELPQSSRRNLDLSVGLILDTSLKSGGITSLSLSMQPKPRQNSGRFSATEKLEQEKLLEKKIDQKLELSFGFNKSGKKSTRNLEFVARQTYYMKSLEYYLSLKSKFTGIGKIYQEHFIETIAGLKYVRTLREPTDETMASIRMSCLDITNAEGSSKPPRFLPFNF